MREVNWDLLGRRVAAAFFVIAVVIAIRLNESGAREAGVKSGARAATTELRREQRTQARFVYVRDIENWREKLLGCVRVKLDRRMNRQGWQSARAARLRAVASGEDELARKSDLQAAERYNLISDNLAKRIDHLDCVKLYPVPPTPPQVRPAASIKEILNEVKEADQDALMIERQVRSVPLGGTR